MKFTLDEIMDEMWHLSSHLVWQMRLDQQRAFEGLGLSPMQAFALMCIAGGMDQPSALAFIMDASPPGISQLLAGLEERGLLRRELDPENKRKVRILLTQEGEELLEKMRQRWKEVSRERFGRLSAEELALLLASYRKLIEPRSEKGMP
ncbi:MarR family winged helix-turn-helix transcriptional regulator [Meiothermus sp. QL-1]|uniref:MarR family winged helix-turn-helix transcriptional regulator n=1 Tax=Meiothermus sp. QL-1 TaxID=2058095 RepID=UPI001F1EC6C4|nr:MarR family transcriptional regulator [Meiothermus sp. QL-1]